MNEDIPDDGMLDDLHEGVAALRDISLSTSTPLSQAAVATIQRLETSMPVARQKVRQWKQRIKDKALRAANKTDQVAHEYPWIFTLSALGIGLISGFVIARISSGSDEEESLEDS